MNREARSRFDGASGGDAEDMDGEDDAHSRHSSVLWERHIEQSIFVDISDDDSLHFSDMEGAFTIHLSQNTGAGAPDSPRLTGKYFFMTFATVLFFNNNGTAMVFAHSNLITTFLDLYYGNDIVFFFLVTDKKSINNRPSFKYHGLYKYHSHFT